MQFPSEISRMSLTVGGMYSDDLGTLFSATRRVASFFIANFLLDKGREKPLFFHKVTKGETFICPRTGRVESSNIL